jgi:hypothetical protein
MAVPSEATRGAAGVKCSPTPSLRRTILLPRLARRRKAVPFVANDRGRFSGPPSPKLWRTILHLRKLRRRMVGTERFELSTSCSRSKRSTRLSYVPISDRRAVTRPQSPGRSKQNIGGFRERSTQPWSHGSPSRQKLTLQRVFPARVQPAQPASHSVGEGWRSGCTP